MNKPNMENLNATIRISPDCRKGIFDIISENLYNVLDAFDEFYDYSDVEKYSNKNKNMIIEVKPYWHWYNANNSPLSRSYQILDTYFISLLYVQRHSKAAFRPMLLFEKPLYKKLKTKYEEQTAKFGKLPFKLKFFNGDAEDYGIIGLGRYDRASFKWMEDAVIPYITGAEK